MFTPEVIEQLQYYVYRLIDPRNGQTFYVGKGKGNRVFAHVADALKNFDGVSYTNKNEDDVSLKIQQIRDIKNDGLEVIHVIHRYGLTEKEALEVEAALIDCYAGLTNVQSGYAVERGVNNVEVLQRALSCEVFEEPKTRKTLRKGGKKTLFSLFSLLGWWMRNHKKAFMPSFSLMDSSGDEIDKTGVSDYLAVNSLTAAKIMKGGDYYADEKDFLSSTGELGSFWKMVGYMLKAVFKGVPGESSEYDRLTFNVPSKVSIQAEGEYKTLEDVQIIEVRKAKKPLLVLMKAEKK